MDWTQAVYLACLILAFAFGRPHWLIVAAMVSNLAATVAFAGDHIAVGLADLLCATALLFSNRRGRVVALLFAAMQPVYVSALAFGWQDSTTYAIVDAIALVQLGVIGGLDVGIGIARRRLAARRGYHSVHPMENGGHASNGVARILAKGARR